MKKIFFLFCMIFLSQEIIAKGVQRKSLTEDFMNTPEGKKLGKEFIRILYMKILKHIESQI